MRTFGQITIWLLLSAVIIVLITYYSLIKIDSGSWIPIFGILAFWGLFSAIWFKRPFIRLAFFNSTVVFVALLLGEAFLEYKFRFVVLQGDVVQEGDCTGPDFFQPDELLGYAPPQDGNFSCRKRSDNELIFEVTYSFKNGKRVIPNTNFSAERQVLFLGCSFTFGEGLEAEETVSFLFNQKSAKAFDIQNRGFSGYGPQHMLAMLQHRDLELLRNADAHHKAVYTFIPDHIRRAAGKIPWVRTGPRYEVVDGEIVYKGSFNFQSEEYQGTSANMRRIKTALFKSRLFYQVFVFRDVTDKDIERTVAIIAESARILEVSGYQFYMIFWDIHHLDYVFRGKQFSYFVEQLSEQRINVLFASEVIKPDEIEKYTIHPKDAHPNRLANEKLARLLLNVSNHHSSNEFVIQVD